jgi:hypothetical protein
VRVPLLPRKSPKVISVGYTLPPLVIPYIKKKHAEFVELFGIAMMSPALSDTERIWYLLEDWKCLLELDVGFLECEFKRGWWLDFESIPGLAESIEKRDDRQGLVGGALHDGFFAVQYPFFDTANSIFYQVMCKEGTNKFRAWYKWAGVQSIFGYKAWNKCSLPLLVNYELRWVTIREVPVVSQSFAHLLRKKHGTDN